MNFIISLVVWVFIFLAATLFKNFSHVEDWIYFWTAIQILSAITFSGFLIVAVFYHMRVFRESVKITNKIKKLKNKVVLREQKYKELSEFYEKYLAKEYPNIEKDIFNKISENKPNELMALLQNYPELKTYIGFGDMVNRISELVKDIYETKEYINAQIEDIDNILTNPWLIWKPKTNVNE